MSNSKINDILTNYNLLDIAISFNYKIVRNKSSRTYPVVTNGSTTLIININKQTYFNPHNDSDRGNIINFLLNHTTLKSYKLIFQYFNIEGQNIKNNQIYFDEKVDNIPSDSDFDHNYLLKYPPAKPSSYKVFSERKLPFSAYQHHSSQILYYKSHNKNFLFIPIYSINKKGSRVCQGGLKLPSKIFIANSNNGNSIYIHQNKSSKTLVVYESFFDLIAHSQLDNIFTTYNAASINGRITEEKIHSILNYINAHKITNIIFSFDNDYVGIFYSVYFFLITQHLDFNYKLDPRQKSFSIIFKNPSSLNNIHSLFPYLNKHHLTLNFNIQNPPPTESTRILSLNDKTYYSLFPTQKDWNDEFIHAHSHNSKI